MGKFGAGPMLEVGIGADLSPFEAAIGELRAEIGQLSNIIGQSGQSVSKGYTPHIDRAGQVTDSFTGFIRQQRQENRLQNFVFRESTQAIGSVMFTMLALTSVTGGQTKEQQKLNKVLVSSFSAYQGVSFGMGALNLMSPGVVTALSAIIGVGVGVLAFLGDAKRDLADVTRELQVASREWAVFNSILGQRAKGTGLMSEKRLTSELNVHLDLLGKIEKRQDEIDVLLATANDEEKKVLEAEKGRLDERHKAEWEFLAAIIQERNIRGSIVGKLEREIEVLEAQKKIAKSLGEVYELNTQIETKKLQVAMANRGSSLEFEMKYISALRQENDLHKLIAKSSQQKLVPTEQIQLISPEQARFGADVINGYIQQQEGLREAWIQTHQTVMDALDIMSAGVGTAFNQFLAIHRQAADEWDAVWIAMENTAVSILGDIVVQAIKNFVIERGMQAAAMVATIASMTAIAAAAAPAAALVSIASFGAAAAIGTASVLASMATIRAASVIGLGEGALAYGPTLAMVGDNPGAAFNPEVIAPLSELRGMGAQRVEVFGKVRIDGRDLVIVFENATDERGRVTGLN